MPRPYQLALLGLVACSLRRDDLVLECPAPTVLCDAACVDLASDARHCGRCGFDCLDSPCDAGACVLAADVPRPISVLRDGDQIYFTAEDRWIHRMPLAGGPSIEFFVSGGLGVDLQATATRLCGVAYEENPEGPIGIMYCVDKTEPVLSTAQLVLDQGAPQCLVVSGGFAYWPRGKSPDGAIMFAPLGETETELLAVDGPMCLAVDSGVVYFTTAGGTVARLGGGGRVALAEGEAGAVGIALDADHVYVGTQTAVRRVPREGGEVVSLNTTRQNTIWRLEVDATHVYWTTLGNDVERGRLMRAPKEGGSEELLYESTEGQIGDLTLDDESIIVADFGGARVVRIGKP
jgi:hypothetical protein